MKLLLKNDITLLYLKTSGQHVIVLKAAVGSPEPTEREILERKAKFTALRAEM
jgi:hypothetical protein